MCAHAGLDMRDCNTAAKRSSVRLSHLTRISQKRRIV
jgi:hypothetical protein